MTSLNLTWSLDGWIVVAGALCAIACSLVGTFLVLRRMSLMGDAISHAVLPGLAAAFLITGSRASVPMFLGAVVAGLLVAVATQWLRDTGKVDEGASMGVAFTSLFAVGLILIVRAADHVDLDPGCVLFGAIEFTPLDTWRIGGIDVPRAVCILAAVTLINAAVVALLFKELRISSFDPALATTLGINARLMHYILMVLTAVTAVAAFESVGSILVVAMMIVPPAAALLLSNRLVVVIALAALIAAASAILGHASAIIVPRFFGYASTGTAGMMAVTAGLIFVAALVASPRNGLAIRAWRLWSLRVSEAAEDLLTLLVRGEELHAGLVHSSPHVARLAASSAILAAARRSLVRQGLALRSNGSLALTPAGRNRGETLLRSHRLWESYMVQELGIRPDHVHATAERLEHITDEETRQRLRGRLADAVLDPHGKPIP